jgi:hypothetical protein
MFINFPFISINEKNWFAESMIFVGVHWMEFVIPSISITQLPFILIELEPW